MNLVILDRDGVINRDSPEFIKSPDEWLPLPGSMEAIARLTAAGARVAVATNQSGVGRGLFDQRSLDAIHQKMCGEAARNGGKIDLVVACPHVPPDRCDCRKPGPGLLHQIARHFGVTLTDVPCIGDSSRDLEAAISVDARPILVLTGNGRKTADRWCGTVALETYRDLAQATDVLLEEVRT